MKTTNIHKTKPHKTKAWFRSPSSYEMDWTYSTSLRPALGHKANKVITLY